MKTLILLFALFLSFQSFAGQNDRFITVTAKGLNESLYTAITNGDLSVTFYKESPSGTVNGSNVTFTLTYTPASLNAFNLYLDGVLLEVGASKDFTISGNTITMISAPKLGQSLYATYTR